MTLVYCYGIVEEQPDLDLQGFESQKVYYISFKDIHAVVSDVSEEHFSQEAIDKQVKDMKWLAINAQIHEDVVDAMMEKTTIIPMTFCTIFKTTENVTAMLEEKYADATYNLKHFKGKPLVLNFWASWCPLCRRSMPKLSEFYEKYGEDVEVIGVNLQERETVARNYVEGADISFPIALDPEGVVARMFGVQYTNYHVLVGKDGSIASVVPGDINESQILSLIEANETPENI